MNRTLALSGILLLSLARFAHGADSNGAASTWPATSEPAHSVKAKGVPNFGKLNESLWRSGQPTREGYQALAAQGLKTVVNLREEFPQDKDLIPPGVKYIYIPITDEKAPTEEQAKQFITAVSDPANWPLLVHCKGGEGRAGTMAAIARHSFDTWDHDKIMKEVGNFRTKHLGFIKTPMAACQQQFIKTWEGTPSVALVQPVTSPAAAATQMEPAASSSTKH